MGARPQNFLAWAEIEPNNEATNAALALSSNVKTVPKESVDKGLEEAIEELYKKYSFKVCIKCRQNHLVKDHVNNFPLKSKRKTITLTIAATKLFDTFERIKFRSY